MRSVPGINLRERFQLTNFNTCYVRLDVNDFSVFENILRCFCWITIICDDFQYSDKIYPLDNIIDNTVHKFYGIFNQKQSLQTLNLFRTYNAHCTLG